MVTACCNDNTTVRQSVYSCPPSLLAFQQSYDKSSVTTRSYNYLLKMNGCEPQSPACLVTHPYLSDNEAEQQTKAMKGEYDSEQASVTTDGGLDGKKQRERSCWRAKNRGSLLNCQRGGRARRLPLCCACPAQAARNA
ncbi:hypothetical protein CRENBAI_012816 [Crenichthys baileyi]|uniref:Uncharacterized protein n=1 Tax=Crenichthys baileyi TaxID=28760 RepID=A0AAV9QNF9_9TELE